MALRQDERGIAAVYLALSITTILVAAAFAVDCGWWFLRAQQAQRAADAAALAAVVWMPGDFPRATAVARETAKANGFAHGVGDVSVEVGAGDNERQIAVRIVDGNVARFFSSVVQGGAMTVSRRAVAQFEQPVPLGSAENQLGGGHRGVYPAVNGLCARRADGDNVSSGYYTLNQPTNPNITCQTPYATATPAPPPAPVQKNPDYRADGYTYVVDIPAAQTSGCATIPQPPACRTTGVAVTIEVLDPLTNTTLSPPHPDQALNQPVSSGCTAGVYPVGTIFSVYGADATPLDLTNNPHRVTKPVYGSESSDSTVWEPLDVIPAGSLAGQYLVKVRSQSDLACSAWSNAFGLRARVGGSFTLCSAITSPSCPQVHGLDAMSLRAYVAGGSVPCVAPLAPTNRCATFFLAQVDPVYAGRKMAITLFDPGEGAQRLRILAPDGSKAGFSWKTTDSSTSMSGTVATSSTGLDVASNSFNDRKLQLTVDLPDGGALVANGGWYKIEYEVTSTGAVEDRTTWSVKIPGSPVHLVK